MEALDKSEKTLSTDGMREVIRREEQAREKVSLKMKSRKEQNEKQTDDGGRKSS